MSNATAAATYAGRGIALVALEGKKPLGTDWQKTPAKAEHWKHYPDHGLGCIHRLSGTCTIDVDHTEWARVALKVMGLDMEGILALGLRSEGNPDRMKAWFRAPPGLTRRSITWPHPSEKDEKGHPVQVTILELRAGDVQDVLPPSIHPDTGKPYRWVDPADVRRPVSEWPPLPADLERLWRNFDRNAWLAACPWREPPERREKLTRERRGESVIDAFNATHDVRSLLEVHGYRRDERSGKYLPPSSKTGMPGVWITPDGQRCFSHNGDMLGAEGRSLDAFDMYRVLDHDGNQKTAVRAAAELLGMRRPDHPPRQEQTQGPQQNEEGDAWPPDRSALAMTIDEMLRAELTPKCIVKNYIYADVGLLFAPGKVGKTTMLLYECVCIILELYVWGLKVENPGWVLFVTKEDSRERLVARTREIMDGIDLSEQQRQKVREGLIFLDVCGTDKRLLTIVDNNILVTRMADDLVAAFRDDPPALVIFDPTISFGASEQRVNDNEDGLIQAGRRIAKGLGCAVRFVHHTGQASAREENQDQYSYRGGTAFGDGSRMNCGLNLWTKDSKATPPQGLILGSDVSVFRLHRHAISYCPPHQPDIWIRRQGFSYQHFTEYATSRDAQADARADQVLRFLESHLKNQGCYHTKKTLEDSHKDLRIPRDDLRGVLARLLASGKVFEAPQPKRLKQGGRKNFLCPANLADQFGEIEDSEPDSDPATSRENPPSTTSRPLRESRGREVGLAPSHSPSPQPREDSAARCREVREVEPEDPTKEAREERAAILEAEGVDPEVAERLTERAHPDTIPGGGCAMAQWCNNQAPAPAGAAAPADADSEADIV